MERTKHNDWHVGDAPGMIAIVFIIIFSVLRKEHLGSMCFYRFQRQSFLRMDERP